MFIVKQTHVLNTKLLQLENLLDEKRLNLILI
jgi:hypothetical protein